MHCSASLGNAWSSLTKIFKSYDHEAENSLVSDVLYLAINSYPNLHVKINFTVHSCILSDVHFLAAMAPLSI